MCVCVQILSSITVVLCFFRAYTDIPDLQASLVTPVYLAKTVYLEKEEKTELM